MNRLNDTVGAAESTVETPEGCVGAHQGSVRRGRLRGRRRTLWLLLSLVVVVVIAAAAGGAYLHFSNPQPLPAGTPQRPAAITVHNQITPVAPTAAQPSRAGVSRAIASVITAPALGTLTGQISDSLTGTVLWSQHANTPRVPASNAKILTASAVLLALPHDKRITTTVVQGAPGRLILTGAGDPTLSAQPAGADTFYTDPGRISDLANQIKRSGIDVRSIAVDVSAYSGPTMDKTWDRADIAGGDITPIEPLMVDGGRSADPLDEFSPRVADPAITAGKALASALGVSTDVVESTAPAGARIVASVDSAPLVTRVDDMNRFSDNVLAESLSIELSMAQGGPATLAGGAAAVTRVLAAKGFDVSGVRLRDSSGLSMANLVPASLLDTLMGAASGPADSSTASGARDALLRPILDGLPVAGGTGTLADRFNPATNPAAGWVRAKTGTLTGVSSLTGIVQTVDGRVLAFALISGGTSPVDARPALDAIPGRLRECGCR